MAKKKSTAFKLSPEAMIEVVSQKNGAVIKKEMTIAEFKKMKKNPSWNYSTYQVGFCSMKSKKEKPIL